MSLTGVLRSQKQERDLTSGGLGRWILTLSLPSTAEVLLFSVSGLLHAFWLGKVGGTALAAVTMGTTLRLVLISPMMGLSAGGMAVVARHVGAREARQADHALMQTLLLLLLFVTPISLLGWVLGRTLLQWMGSGADTGSLIEEALTYLRIILIGLFFMECLPTMNGVIRGAGHPEHTLRINVVNVATMMVLQPVLVLGWGPFPALGVRGAAWAAVLSSAAGVGAQAVVLWRGWAGLRFHWEDLRPDPVMMRRVLKIALPTAAQRFSPNLANAILIRLVSSFGSDVLTAYSIMIQISGFLQGPSQGLANAAATLIGQNLGANRPDRAERSAFLAATSALGCTLLAFGSLALWPQPIFGLFHSDDHVLRVGITLTRYALLIGGGTAWLTVMTFALSGAGDATANMLINMGSLWGVQLPLCWALSRGFQWGPAGIWLGLGTSAIIGAIALTLRFRQGTWKQIVV